MQDRIFLSFLVANIIGDAIPFESVQFSPITNIVLILRVLIQLRGPARYGVERISLSFRENEAIWRFAV